MIDNKLIKRAILHEIDRLSSLIQYLEDISPEQDRWTKGLVTKSKKEVSLYKEILR